jgi:hypothetical protein
VGVSVGVGSGVGVAVGVGEAAAVDDTTGVAEAAAELVANGEGAGCEVQAFNRTSASALETMSAFMRAIMAETRPCVNATKTRARMNGFDTPLPVC